ncbi:ferritin-like domain-containing protein [Marmoricola sp. RAF53]|uniref:ferritin-like domain-containing protein n=1 Tax=Marmoricola sp. RAF53 TaxID=3233059 RepID=UPI003F9E886B
MTPVEALQAALAGEHAAVYSYGAIGARTSASAEHALYAAMLAAFRAHRKRRDQLTVMVQGHGETPVAAEVDYEVTTALGTPAELSNAALQVERRIARTFNQLVESTAGAERRWALVALDDAAVRQVEFRGTPEMFPGTT